MFVLGRDAPRRVGFSDASGLCPALLAASLAALLIACTSSAPPPPEPGTPVPDRADEVASPAAEPSVVTSTAAESPAGVPASTSAVLAACPCQPARTSTLFDVIYRGARPAPAAALPSGLTAAELLQIWAADYWETLWRRGGEPLAVEGAALFEHPRLAERAPDPVLRLAVGLLLGTVAEPVIDSIVRGDAITAIGFGATPHSDILAQSIPQPDGSNHIVISELAIHEHPGLLAPVLAHEALHQDELAGREEEGIAALVQSLVLAEMIRDFPAVAERDTDLLQAQAVPLFALLVNSHSLLQSRGELYPGSAIELDRFWDDSALASAEEAATPGNDLLTAILRRLGVDADDETAFDRSLLERLLIEELVDHPGFLEPVDLIAVADTLSIELGQPAAAVP